MFQINDKVVCIYDGNQDDPIARIQKGQIYVVREIVDCRGGPGLRLVGVFPSKIWRRWKMRERCWDSLRFRKLADIKAENAAKRASNRTNSQTNT